MSDDHRQDSPPEASRSIEAATGQSSSRPRNRVRQSLQTLKDDVTKIVSKQFNISRINSPALRNEGASSNQNIEDPSQLHPKHRTTPENLIALLDQGSSGPPPVKVLDAPSDVGEDTNPESALRDARKAVEGMKLLGRHETSAASAANNALADLDSADIFQTTYLQSLRTFNIAIEKLADVDPYAKMALGMLSAASKIVLAQADCDQSVHRLLKKLDEVYGFMTQEDTLGQISSMHSIVGQIARQTLECAHFIRDYSEAKSFWKRLGKNIVSETEDMITRHSGALDELMQQFRDRTLLDVPIFVQSTGKNAGETLDLGDMPYAKGAGLDTRKQCLPGTRTEILSQITEWINSSGDAAQRVLWLSGPAGTGKSAIAHTIAKWFNDMGGIGSCFCFDRTRTDNRHEKVFSTIARDLADRDPEMRRALANAVRNDISLKNTKDILQQWEKFLIEPLGKRIESSVGPVLIVIEALDESGRPETRRNLLRILAGKLQGQGIPNVTELPPNVRILVISRPLHDINEEFEGAQHILRLSMDDIPPQVADRDIFTFVSEELKGHPVFGDREFAILVVKAEGLFEWARLACEHIKNVRPGINLISRFNAVVNSGAGKRNNLLYNMYRLILRDIMSRDQYTDGEYEKALAEFRSVMGQILGMAEPLPFNSLNIMRGFFPDESRHYNMDIIQHMGSLLRGTTNASTPIQLLHASFGDFLTDKSASGDFFVDV